jgi:hypothetical protein
VIPGLPERLRKAFGYTHDAPSILTEAAEEIENLRSQVDEQNALLRELNDALMPIPSDLQARLDAVLDRAEEK